MQRAAVVDRPRDRARRVEHDAVIGPGAKSPGSDATRAREELGGRPRPRRPRPAGRWRKGPRRTSPGARSRGLPRGEVEHGRLAPAVDHDGGAIVGEGERRGRRAQGGRPRGASRSTRARARPPVFASKREDGPRAEHEHCGAVRVNATCRAPARAFVEGERERCSPSARERVGRRACRRARCRRPVGVGGAGGDAPARAPFDFSAARDVVVAGSYQSTS